MSNKSFSTRAVHAGERAPHPDYTPVVTPIHPSVGFVYDSMDDLDAIFATTREGYVYPRYGSPTVAAFEAAIADLEGGEAAHAFASGMAAIHVALLAAGVRAGTSVVAAMDLYGATYTLLQRLLAELGAAVRFVDVTDLTALEAALAETHPVALLAEIISNPLLKVADVPALAEPGASLRRTVVDRQHFCLALSLQSAGSRRGLCHPQRHQVHRRPRRRDGGRGRHVRRKPAQVVRVEQAGRQRARPVRGVAGVARDARPCPCACASSAPMPRAWPSGWPGIRKIARVNYPGLPVHPQHDLARRLFGERGFGGMLSFEIAGADRAGAFRFMEALDLCLPATTLGDIYTLVLHPVTSSHRSLSAEERAKIGIGEGLVRLSAGIEDAGDIIADLEQALAQV